MSDAGGAQRAHARLQAILKAVVVGQDVSDPASREAGESTTLFSSAGALEPPYDPAALCLLVEHSNALRQNLDAYAVNIDGFGHRLEPAIDFEAEDADARVADAIFLERSAARERGELEDGAELEPTDEEVAARKRELIHLARVERARLQSFFDFCCFDHSFVDLRRRTRQDLETTGNAYWEVLRDGRGEIARLVYVPSHTVRLMPLDAEPVEVEDRVQVSPVAFEAVPARRRLRRYVQVQGTDRVYFKAFGDPRAISKRTGAVFPSVEALRRADQRDGPATEILHFAIHSPRTPYGVPRWVGALLAVLGSRQMEEVNYLYFENKSVPPLALLISGGRLSESSVPRIERFIEENLKGKTNFHKILILEAEGGQGENRARIELRPLTDAQQQDALFQVYDERNIDKVGGAFRLPRLLRGESKDFNRATAESALRFAEDQVFQPERDEFDYLINRKLLADMGIRFWRFRSQTPVTRDPERMTAMVEKLVRVGVLTPEEGRFLAGDIFNREFRKIGDDWTKRPITLTLAGIQTGVQDLRVQTEKGSLLDDARRLLTLREELATEQARLADRRVDLARRYLDEHAERVPVPREEFDTWFDPEARDDA
ncbi:MAG: phage portal protein [Myxococcales bacterium]|nr:phage portal protein [Myxococcales bacterium]